MNEHRILAASTSCMNHAEAFATAVFKVRGRGGEGGGNASVCVALCGVVWCCVGVVLY
jgi:hypothetical protein